jgi:hypothetical protein
MKRLSMLVILIFSRMTFAEPTAADREVKTPEQRATLALVKHDLLQPLIAKEEGRSKFSRARMPPEERRVRILDEQPSKDAQGIAFVRFSIDARWGMGGSDDENHWRRDDITGCVYLDKNQIFVKSGDQYRPAAFLLGKNLKAAAQSTCQPVSAQVAATN